MRDDGTVRAWGYNLRGQPGNGTNADSNVPVQVNGIVDVVQVIFGMGHILALKADGTAWAWGSNDWGQLGIGSPIASTTPVAVTGVCPSTASLGDGTTRARPAVRGSWRSKRCAERAAQVRPVPDVHRGLR